MRHKEQLIIRSSFIQIPSFKEKNKSMEQIKHQCEKCGQEIRKDNKSCLHCGTDISKIDKNPSLSLADSIKVSDDVFIKIIDDVKWDSSELSLIGILFTLVVGLVPLLNIFLNNFWLSSALAFIVTILLMILFAKSKLIKRPAITFFRWLLK